MNQAVFYRVFYFQLSELGGRSEWRAGVGGPRGIHFLWHGCSRHPGQRTYAGSQSVAGETLFRHILLVIQQKQVSTKITG